MNTKNDHPPLVVIVGPTASGKTGLAVSLAKRFGGEVISADSRAVYRGLDIGTAKPTMQEQQGVPHWGIDIADPDQRFTVVDFQRYAYEMIDAIQGRGHVPFLVGGTGLYVDSVLYGYEFPPSDNVLNRREELMKLNLRDLYEYCVKNNIQLPENRKNKRYVVNNILRQGIEPKRRGERYPDAIVVGIATEKDILYQRITERASDMFSSGVIAESEEIANIYGWESEAMTGNIYPIMHDYLDGRITNEEARQKFIVQDRRLAKRQLTWFRRNEHILWLDVDAAHTYITRKLQDYVNT